MVSDSEPRFRLDSDGNIVGSLYAQSDGTLALQEGTSGSDTEVTVATDGTFNAPAVSTDVLDTGWAIDAGGYSDLQSALNDANSAGVKRIIIPPGTYGAINPHAGQVLIGQGSALNSDVVIDGGSGAAVDDGNMPTNFIIQNCELRNDTGGGEAASVMDPDGVKFIDCYISQAAEEGLDLRGSHIQVKGCDFADGANITNESVLLRSPCENCTVRNNTRTGTINDSGTDNSVGGNT